MRTVRTILAAAVLGAALAAPPPAAAQGSAFASREETAESLPPGPGREETFGLCSACHAYRLVSNQGMSRERWDDTLTLMTTRHNMPDLQGDERALVLDYLASAHPERAAPARGGFRNPFAPQ
jgi:hypothetical protein